MTTDIQTIVSKLQYLEGNLMAIILEAAMKISKITDNDLFVLIKSSDHRRKIYGDLKLIRAFQNHQLKPSSDDLIVGVAPPVSQENHSIIQDGRNFDDSPLTTHLHSPARKRPNLSTTFLSNDSQAPNDSSPAKQRRLAPSDNAKDCVIIDEGDVSDIIPDEEDGDCQDLPSADDVLPRSRPSVSERHGALSSAGLHEGSASVASEAIDDTITGPISMRESSSIIYDADFVRVTSPSPGSYEKLHASVTSLLAPPVTSNTTVEDKTTPVSERVYENGNFVLNVHLGRVDVPEFFRQSPLPSKLKGPDGRLGSVERNGEAEMATMTTLIRDLCKYFWESVVNVPEPDNRFFRTAADFLTDHLLDWYAGHTDAQRIFCRIRVYDAIRELAGKCFICR